MMSDRLTVSSYDYLQSTIVARSNYVMASILPAHCLNLFDMYSLVSDLLMVVMLMLQCCQMVQTNIFISGLLGGPFLFNDVYHMSMWQFNSLSHVMNSSVCFPAEV